MTLCDFSSQRTFHTQGLKRNSVGDAGVKTVSMGLSTSSMAFLSVTGAFESLSPVFPSVFAGWGEGGGSGKYSIPNDRQECGVCKSKFNHGRGVACLSSSTSEGHAVSRV